MATRTIGRQAVFKPEVAGRFSATGSPLQAGLAPRQQMTRVNVAVQKTVAALGTRLQALPPGAANADTRK